MSNKMIIHAHSFGKSSNDKRRRGMSPACIIKCHPEASLGFMTQPIVVEQKILYAQLIGHRVWT